MAFLFKYWHTIASVVVLTGILGVFGAMKLDIHFLNSKLATANQQLSFDKTAIEAQNASIEAYKGAQKQADASVALADKQVVSIGDTLQKTLEQFHSVKVPQTCSAQIDYLRSFAPSLAHWPSQPAPPHQ